MPEDSCADVHFRRLLESARPRSVAYFGPALFESGWPAVDLEWFVEQETRSRGIPCAIHRVPALSGCDAQSDSASQTLLGRLVSCLAEFKQEVEERVPEYFEYHALRVHGEEGQLLAFLDANRPGPRTAPNLFAATVGDCFESIGMALGINIVVCPPGDTANSVDTALQGMIRPYLATLTAVPPQDIPCKPDCLNRAIGELAAVAGTRDCCLPLTSLMTANQAAADLVYYAGGSGSPLLIIGALGCPLDYWARLIPRLLSRHRVMIWQLRSGEDPSHTPSRQDHLADLESILSAEGVARCDVIGWCTGAKLAIEFHRRDPARVRAIVFLNGTLKCDAYCDEEETSYERNLERLCHAVECHPELAGMLIGALGPRSKAAPDLDEADRADVMALPNTRLAEQTLYPFRSEAAAVLYARQILDFLSHDVRPVVHEIDAPVLWIGCEYDRIASPRSARRASEWLPRCRYAEIQGATHYGLFDRPRIVAGLIDHFLSNPGAALSGVADRENSAAAVA